MLRLIPSFKIPKINLTIQLIVILVGTLFLGAYIPLIYKSFFYAVSATLKEFLLFLLPFIIFSCLFYSMAANQGRAIRFVILVLLAVCVSNFLSIMASYGFALFGFSKIAMISSEQAAGTLLQLQPLWTIQVPVLLKNEWSLALGLGAGVLCSLLPYQKPIEWGRKANLLVTLFLKKIFIPLLPLFAFGFVLKMESDGVLGSVLGTYAPIILLVTLSTLLYVILMFGVATQFKARVWMNAMKNALPVGVLGFTTMSSLATMPVTLTAAEKNTRDPELARAIIPATVNIHMIGDSVAIPILAMGVLLTYGYPLPTLLQYLVFTQFFMLAKFGVPGVPCGSMLVMLPVFEKYLGFTGEMSAFIAAIYILFDPIVTAGNVLGNSALVIMIARWMRKVPVKEEGMTELSLSGSLESESL